MAWEANGTAELAVVLVLLQQNAPGDERVTVGGDKGYDSRDFDKECRHMKVTPHVAQNDSASWRQAVDERTTRYAGYRTSQRKR